MTLNPRGYAPQTLVQLKAGRSISAIDYLAALRFRDVLRREVEELFDNVDVVISPSVPFVAPFTDPVVEDDEEGEMLSSGLANLIGHPAVSLPAGLSDGLPVGLQLMGSLAGDHRLLSIASAIEVILHDGCMTKPARGP
jgi:aspartyl-tRNA(Asn)/glutamyl-tRNA(Gln) amidotransferase subunit A